MPKWADLNAANPADTEVVSQGASRIRDTVAAGKETWAVEHLETGEHNFPVAQPGAPTSGQIWFDLANKVIRRYDGADHAMVNAVGAYYTAPDAAPGSSISLTGTFQTIRSVSGVVVPVNGRVIVVASLSVIWAESGQVNYQFVRDSTALEVERTTSQDTTTGEDEKLVCFVLDTPAAGTYAYHIQARRLVSPVYTVTANTTSNMLALVV